MKFFVSMPLLIFYSMGSDVRRWAELPDKAMLPVFYIFTEAPLFFILLALGGALMETMFFYKCTRAALSTALRISMIINAVSFLFGAIGFPLLYLTCLTIMLANHIDVSFMVSHIGVYLMMFSMFILSVLVEMLLLRRMWRGVTRSIFLLFVPGNVIYYGFMMLETFSPCNCNSVSEWIFYWHQKF